jgi:hypothetical protein
MNMQSKDWLMFRVLLNKFHSDSTDLFLKNMPQTDSAQVLRQNITSKDAASMLAQPTSLIEKVHYSWFLDTFKEIPEALKPSILASLPLNHAEGIAKTLNIPFTKLKLSDPFKRFLINTLYTRFEKKEILPIEFLPETSLTLLSSFTKAKLVTIIDFLGIFDLAEEIRHIVEKNALKSIYEAIPPKKQQFLKQCLNQKEKLVTPRCDLDNWDKTADSLNKLLHKRGMIRLSHALSGQHPDFCWHIIHLLDSGRGKIIAAHYKPHEIPAVSQVLAGQVINVINFLNKSGKT